MTNCLIMYINIIIYLFPEQERAMTHDKWLFPLFVSFFITFYCCLLKLNFATIKISYFYFEIHDRVRERWHQKCVSCIRCIWKTINYTSLRSCFKWKYNVSPQNSCAHLSFIGNHTCIIRELIMMNFPEHQKQHRCFNCLLHLLRLINEWWPHLLL